MFTIKKKLNLRTKVELVALDVIPRSRKRKQPERIK